MQEINEDVFWESKITCWWSTIEAKHLIFFFNAFFFTLFTDLDTQDTWKYIERKKQIVKINLQVVK